MNCPPRRRLSRRSALRTFATSASLLLAGCVDRSAPGTARPTTRTPAATTDEPTTEPSSTEDPTTDEPNLEGPVDWTFETGGSIPDRPAISDGVAAIPSEDATLYGLAESTGEERWRFEGEQPFLATTAIGDGTILGRSGIYDLGGEQVVYALDVATGEERWRFSEPWWLEILGERDGVVYVATEDDAIDSTGETLYAMSLDDGTELWTAEIGDPSGGLVTDETVYVPTYDYMYAIDAETGEQRWEVEAPWYSYRTVAEAGDVVCYVGRDGDERGVLFARDAATGEVLWSHDDWFVSSTTIHDGVLIGGGQHVAAFEPESGKIRWQTDERGFVPQASVQDGILYAGGDEALAIEVADGTVRWSWEPTVSIQGLVPAGVGHGAAYFDSFRDGDPRNKYKFAVDVELASERWTFGPDTDLTDLAVGDERVVVGGKNGVAHGLTP